MGWKISVLIINHKYDNKITMITEDLRLGKSVIEGETSLGRSLYPNSLCIGFYNDKTIITHGTIMKDFFSEKPSLMEQRITELFKDTEIIVLGQIEGMGVSGFSYIRKGQRVITRLLGKEKEVLPLGDEKELQIEKGVDDYDLPFMLPKLFTDHGLDSDTLLNTKMYVLKIRK